MDAWCKTTAPVGASGSGSSATVQQVAEVSFTNTDPTKPTGLGWWQVDPATVSTGNGTLNPATLTNC